MSPFTELGAGDFPKAADMPFITEDMMARWQSKLAVDSYKSIDLVIGQSGR